MERLWRMVKYECIYLNAFEDECHWRDALGHDVDWYYQQRPHIALDGASPDTRYFGNVNHPALVA